MHIVIARSLIFWLAASVAASAADIAAGRNAFTASCSGCHQLKGFAGKTNAELETELTGIVAGTKAHPMKLTLSRSDIVDISAFIAHQ